jgi:hypothetical protein
MKFNIEQKLKLKQDKILEDLTVALKKQAELIVQFKDQTTLRIKLEKQSELNKENSNKLNTISNDIDVIKWKYSEITYDITELKEKYNNIEHAIALLNKKAKGTRLNNTLNNVV